MMEAPIRKRDYCDRSNISEHTAKKLKSFDAQDDKLCTFLSWCKSEKLLLSNKVRVSKDGSCAQYGMIATEPVDTGETLFEIPRSILLNPETSGIAQLLKDEHELIKSDSGWVPLLLCLLYETTCDNSRWKPYLNLVPDYNKLDLPMFWSRTERDDLLSETGILSAVTRDLESIEREFNSVVLPFVKRHRDVFPTECVDFELYKQLVAFVMSYSFSEPTEDVSDDSSEDDDDDEVQVEVKKNGPMMVPMADILNHVAKNNARLDFGVDSLKMVATKPIAAGDEVFNTYGELANWQLLHMYGFAEPPTDNHYDAMELPMNCTLEIIKENLSTAECELADEKWNFLKKTGIVTDDGAFVIGKTGFLTEEEMYQTLRVMAMDGKEFAEHREKEGWSDAEDESRDDTSRSLTFDDISALPATWLALLTRLAQSFLKPFSRPPTQQNSCSAKRLRFAEFVRNGQRDLLDRLLKSFKGELADSSNSMVVD